MNAPNRNPQQSRGAPRGGQRNDRSGSDAKVKICYVITERGGKNFWTKIGVAFTNQDGSINVKLDAFPVGGELQIRDYVPREDNGNEGSGDRG